MIFSCRGKRISKYQNYRIRGGLGGFGTDLAIVIDPYSTLTLQNKYIREGERSVKGTWPLHCYAGEIGTLVLHKFFVVVISLCCRYWRLTFLEKSSRRSRLRFREVPSLRRR